MTTNKIVSNCGLPLLLACALSAAFVPACVEAQAGPDNSAQPDAEAALAASAKMTAPASQGAGPQMIPRDFSALRVEPGDLLNVSVYDTPELSNSYRVDADGSLTIPLCGRVKVRGLTLSEAARRLEKAFKDDQILVHPQVNVDLLQYSGQSVTVTGQVENPGRIPLFAPEKLGDILAQVGGETPLAGARITILHGSGDDAQTEEVIYTPQQQNSRAASILVRPGDSIDVSRAGIVYVLGAVNRPGGYVMQEGGKLNVAEALALAGGTQMEANTAGLRVIRRNPDGTVLDFPLSYNAISKGTQAPLALQARDIVYVPMSKLKASLSNTTGILSAAASAAIVTR